MFNRAFVKLVKRPWKSLEKPWKYGAQCLPGFPVTLVNWCLLVKPVPCVENLPWLYLRFANYINTSKPAVYGVFPNCLLWQPKGMWVCEWHNMMTATASAQEPCHCGSCKEVRMEAWKILEILREVVTMVVLPCITCCFLVISYKVMENIIKNHYCW